MARLRSEEMIASGRSAASSRAARSACSMPTSSSWMSVWPWKRPWTFHGVCPCRHNTSRTRESGPGTDSELIPPSPACRSAMPAQASAEPTLPRAAKAPHPRPIAPPPPDQRRTQPAARPGTPGQLRGGRAGPRSRRARRSASVPGGWPAGARSADRHRLGQLDLRAVLPQPFQSVERALLGVLHVDHDVQVVQQHPTAFALALTAHRAGPGLAQVVLDRLDDGPYLTVIGRRAEQEHVGDDELLTHVVGDDVAGELVGRGRSGYLRKLNGPGGGSHVWYSSSSAGDPPPSLSRPRLAGQCGNSA